MDDDLVEFVKHPDAADDVPEPSASSNVLPWWYEQLPPFTTEAEEPYPVKTVRLCPAFLDALSLGWILHVEEEMDVEAGGTITVDTSWAPKTPDGYSLLICKPMNRLELRWEVVPQLIPTDETFDTVSVTLISRMERGGSVVQPGEPLVQLIPIHRDTLLTEAYLRPFQKAGLDSYDTVKMKSQTDSSWYRKKHWTPKGSRVVES